MKKIYFIIALTASISLSSCEDFLNQVPEHELVQENAVIDYNSAKNIVNGMYSNYASSKNTGGYIYGNLHMQAGIYKTGGKSAEAFYNMTYSQSTDESTTYTFNIWDDLYICINAANAAIKGVSDLDVSKFPSEKVKNDLIAEARCFRGFINLQLMWLFSHWFDNAESPYGILYRDQLSDLSNLMIDRSSVGDSYQYIIDDFEYAEQNLHDYTSAKYMSKQFAQVMHAKLLLVRGWEGDYAKALELVNNVISTAPSIFKMEPNITKLYEDAWDSNEVLFARYLGQGDLTWDLYNYEYTYSKGLYDSEFRDIPNEWIEKDERHDYTFGEAGGGENWQAEIINENVLTKLYHRGAANGPNDKYCTYVFRYAELYLMKAELLARTNPSDIQGALKPLNDMRAQYTTPVMSPITGITTHEQLMDAIFKEYVVTLLMENETPWFASVRFKKDGKTWLEVLKPDVNISTNKYCWPIPYAEIIAHTNKIEQNPGLE
ncbi:RagB/SusD family nutrient uptake outer membrane protein [Phocaeicola sartorii]|uniref:RagB/SusD family nutrient uptake outer membrane protein n=1 Tax=Phocaeicola sartorii TaxID=671267 RepID=R9I6A3_9BACT|nr:RagB/SusD family nutrient uptake outer membrane protein [Phocaeicola sartorii]EOS11772.1 hypothetical protein C802_02885 [Phocaeicola sartorii]MCR1845554.1 RagB/SusD family nutrient uptake outer membrane protein [Phocaeicola sartorii]NUK97462.1 RagB/SusD family nutrient uptake outer membrane protein [Phocaeicola sartorii]